MSTLIHTHTYTSFTAWELQRSRAGPARQRDKGKSLIKGNLLYRELS